MEGVIVTSRHIYNNLFTKNTYFIKFICSHSIRPYITRPSTFRYFSTLPENNKKGINLNENAKIAKKSEFNEKTHEFISSNETSTDKKKFKTKVSEKSKEFKLFALLTLKKYGKLGAFTYFGIYVATLAGFTVASYNGFLSDEDIKRGLKLMHLENIKCPDLDGKFSRFLVAYIACKMVEPIRLIATIILVTIITKVTKNRAIKRLANM